MRSLTIPLFIPLILISCSRVSEDALHQMAQTAFQEQRFQEAAQHFEHLVTQFPQGMHTEESLFLLANIYYENLQDNRKAISAHQRLRSLFPNGEKAPAALFLIGFIYNNQLHLYDSAKIAYEEFLIKYPNHDMAASAKFEVENLGKNPDELFKAKTATTEKQPRVSDKTKSKKRMKK